MLSSKIDGSFTVNTRQCHAYNVIGLSAAKNHMLNFHGISTDPSKPSQTEQKRQQDLRTVVGKQTLKKQEQESQVIKDTLRAAANRTKVRQALLRLIVHHDLPLCAVEWPELHTLVYTINHEAGSHIWSSHQSVANNIRKTFEIRRLEVEQQLQRSQSIIHLTTDTWHSPNRKEFQAITAHFVDDQGIKQKGSTSPTGVT